MLVALLSHVGEPSGTKYVVASCGSRGICFRACLLSSFWLVVVITLLTPSVVGRPCASFISVSLLCYTIAHKQIYIRVTSRSIAPSISHLSLRTVALITPSLAPSQTPLICLHCFALHCIATELHYPPCRALYSVSPSFAFSIAISLPLLTLAVANIP